MEEGKIDHRRIGREREYVVISVYSRHIGCSNFRDLPNGYVHYRLRVTRHLSCPIYHHWHISGVGQVIFSRCGCVYVACICVALESNHDSARVMTTSIRHTWIYVQLYFLPSAPRRPLPPPPHKLTTDYLQMVGQTRCVIFALRVCVFNI